MPKLLGVCGDSWFAATQNIFSREDCRDSNGKHFSEILANKIGYQLYTLARGACSNSAIRLQISEMVKRKVDFIIIGTTSVNRIEYPKFENREYDPNNGIHNLIYSSHPDLSSVGADPSKEVLFSDTLTNIFGNKHNSAPVRSEIQRDAIKNYYLEMFDLKFREQQDSWIIASGIQEIKNHNIPYLLLGNYWLRYSNYFNNNPRELIEDKNLSPWVYGTDSVRRWHTDDKTQQTIADKIYGYIMVNSLLENPNKINNL